MEEEIRGYMTETCTGFGRHYGMFQKLERSLKKRKIDSLKCLVVGPGLDYGATGEGLSGKNVIRTYQPYELANALRRGGVKNYEIDVMDINPKVLDEMRKSPTYLEIRADFWNHVHPSDFNEDPQKEKRYFNTFFTDQVRKSSGIFKMVEIPKIVNDRMNLSVGDIMADDIPKGEYDVAVCTVLLSHYGDEFFSGSLPAVREVCNKLEESVKPNGYVIGTFPPIDFKFLKDMATSTSFSASIHDTSATLFQKRVL
jgi:hypothetical protein